MDFLMVCSAEFMTFFVTHEALGRVAMMISDEARVKGRCPGNALVFAGFC